MSRIEKDIYLTLLIYQFDCNNKLNADIENLIRITESKNKKGALYGYNELKNLIQTIDCVTLRAEEICDIIKNTILRYSEYDLSDDMTVVVVKITK